MINSAISTFGSLDILVNNAGLLDNFIPVGESARAAISRDRQ